MSKAKNIKWKINRINRTIGNTEIGKDGRLMQLCKERDQLEEAFYRECYADR